ncbi:prepilin-type N-terminal cleavage/methylation domain-containing protein [Pseudolysobacter antarcticus]|uniref:Type II secretion system protein H n=1 Tax=Pseudolysobacter antarcticus TaxID=2511995 RepID=A0A411HQ84_9GAMM|nr:GspH/FimT family pseudopilin [Pseudolysobacter antarcticus]QBB72668.1 prepilin-type N-terminal cleavage/methylation domain-containing protein [Pseudolysobacter antarcticus]
MYSERNEGFSLIELLVVLLIVGILFVVSMPSFSTWIQNGKTRSVAESMQNGLRFAQTEGLRLSRTTTFTLSTTGWTVDYVQNSASDTITPHPLLVSPSSNLGGVVITPSAGTPAILEFNTFGRVLGGATAAGTFTALGNADATYDITNPSGPRKQRVIVSQSGKVRMCDPDAGGLSASRPDGC